ncbi:hypothetical protein PpBr36_07115 [Pyricularia pennisetigena]|uniref:hypothetical protein n=1 Tax=Pyricularia pennisetigena TaxID=1578925 RepID=UPI00114E26A7|nr:hypothetical protein PpBr36_07115 [Pyricularia pennisetigena]TLS25839.1 hypothetical protein PpBr36_07115 [Pyricularia pennisetigena]
MPRVSQSKDMFTVLEDPVEACVSPLSFASEHSDTHTDATFESTILGELDVSQAQNKQTPGAARSNTADSLVYRLDHFHITSPQKTEFCAIRAVAKRPQLEEYTFVPPHLKAETDCIVQCEGPDTGASSHTVDTDSVLEGKLTRPLTPTTRSLVHSVPWAKHQAGEFEYILSVPASSSTAEKYYRDSGKTPGSYNTVDANETEKLYFGCNLLETKLGAEVDDSSEAVSDISYKPPVFTLLATPIRNPTQGLAHTITATTDGEMAIMDNDGDAGTDSTESRFVLHKSEEGEPMESLPKDAQILKVSSARPIIMARPRTERIEDSFEALDEFEEQLEELDKVIRAERVPSPDKMFNKTSPAHSTVKRTSSTTTTRRTSTIRTTTTEVSRSGSARRSDRTPSLAQDAQSRHGPGSTPSKRNVARPASLQPPKPLAKSSRPTTRSNFELPGEAVARRLKEEREARLLRASAAKAAVEESSPARTRSTRAPTRPTFELPGEAISRRKREEHQAKLRAQEEEERKRREFKARPIKSSVAAPSSFPRETATSRARQSSKVVSKSESSASPVRKRLTIAGGSSPSRRTLGGGSGSEASSLDQARGRDATSLDSRTRGVSSSTGSTSISKGSSTVSAEELQMQRRRGREIFKRDNNFSVDRGAEQRERENMAKLARQEAAERSRQLSREWAQRRQSKRISNMMQSAPTIPDASVNDIAVR